MEPVILYVEDDPISREVMNIMLTRILGYNPVNVYIFENSADFQQRLQTLPQTPTIIFLDIHMDPLDGFTLLTLIRQDEAYNNTKVVALTASVMNEEVKRLKEVGFMGVIAKPISTDSFPEMMQRILQNEPIWTIR